MWCRKWRGRGSSGPGASGSIWIYVYFVVDGLKFSSEGKEIVGSWRVSG
jgi:hypothetical protein